LHARVGPGVLTISELLETDALLYYQALSDREAYQAGIEQARAEAAGNARMNQMLAGRQGRAEA
jgi:hypothetical protein